MRKTVMIAALTALAWLGAYGQPRQVMLDKVVAVVGNSSISYSEVKRFADMLTEQYRQQGFTSDRDPLNESLEQLLMQKLLYNQALVDSIEVNLAGIQSNVESQVQGMIEAEGSIAAVEAKEHMPIYQLREVLRRQSEEQAYAQAMQQEVIGRVKIVPGEVERFYKRTDKEDLPLIGDQYVYAHITKYPKSKESVKQRTKEFLLQIRERIINGEDFKMMAMMYSMDGAAFRGGEMEPQPLAAWYPEFGDAVKELTPGKLSGVVETPVGFHLIELLDKKGQNYHVRHIIRMPEYTPEEEVAPLLQLDSLARMIRADSITFEQAALEFSDDPHSCQNGGVVTNSDLLARSPYGADARYTETRFLKEEFGQPGLEMRLDDLRALLKLKPGEVSDAFATRDIDGSAMGKIVKLVRLIPTHTASLEEDYLRLEQLALNEKQDRAFQEWLSKKIDGMYVSIDPEFRDGEFVNKHWVK